MKFPILLSLLGLQFSIMAEPISENSTHREVLQIDWPSFIGKQDLYWNTLPQEWNQAPFIGNGMMGSMIFRQDDHHLVIQLGRSDVQDHRMEAGKHEVPGRAIPNQSRLPIGYFTLKTAGKLKDCDLRLNLWDAEISGKIRTEVGEIDLIAVMHSGKDLLALRATPSKRESSFSIRWHPEEAFCPRIKDRRAGGKSYIDEYFGSPLPVFSNEGEVILCIQDLIAGGQTTTAWSVKHGDHDSQTLYASVGHSFPENTATETATNVVKDALDSDFSEHLETHRPWWNEFYTKSYVSIPDARLESFFWIQHYKMACATMGGRALADNQGPWLQPTGWPALWWNLNVQLAYSHMLPANHPELSIGLLNHLVKYQHNLEKNVPEGMEDSINLNTNSGQDLLSPMDHPLKKPKQSAGNMTWVMHNCYMQYRYTMDEDILREKIFPLLRKSINFYRHILEEGDDGKLHLPPLASPEYGHAANCNYDLALLRWGCQTLIDSCNILKIQDTLLPEWKDILARLTDYPIDETGFMIGKDMPYARSHRHYSHLMMIYPLSTFSPDLPENRKLIEKSINHWFSYPKGLAGYSFTGSSSMYSILGNGEMAEKRLQDFLNDKVHPNTFYSESSPVIETPPAGARSIEDMLIQSWGDRIRVLPAIPDKWKDVSFADLRTEGAFLISAKRESGKTVFVAIKSLAGAPCRIQTGIEGEILVTGLEDDKIRDLGNGILELDIPANAQVIVSSKSLAPDQAQWVITPSKQDNRSDWQWGMEN
jgi:alpha-L-fucosidase 2